MYESQDSQLQLTETFTLKRENESQDSQLQLTGMENLIVHIRGSPINSISYSLRWVAKSLASGRVKKNCANGLAKQQFYWYKYQICTSAQRPILDPFRVIKK